MTDLQKTASYDEDVKGEFGHIETARGHIIETPAELACLTADERAAVAKSTTRKVRAPALSALRVANPWS